MATDTGRRGVSSPELYFHVAHPWILIPNWCLMLVVLQHPYAGARDACEHLPLAAAVALNALLCSHRLWGADMHFPRRTWA